MRIEILLFASLRDRLGQDRVSVEVPGDAPRVSDLLQAVAALHPALGPALGTCRVAVNHAFARADQVIAAPDEVALIPPVSGGAPRFWVTRDALDARTIEALVSGPDAGALVTFAGTVRDHTAHHGVIALDYEIYPEMATRVLESLGAEVETRWPGARIAIVHRYGRLLPGEISVFIAVAHAHRAPAFEACRHAIERLKEDAPVWKREERHDGSVWVGQGS